MKKLFLPLLLWLLSATAFAAAPTAPTSLTVTAYDVNNAAMTLQWTPGTGTQISTLIYQDGVLVKTTTGNTAIVNQLTFNLPYSFYAVTKDINNLYSASSNTVTATLVKNIQFIGGQNVLMYGNVTGTSTTKPLAINPDGTLILGIGNVSITAVTSISQTVNVSGTVSVTGTVNTVGTITNTVQVAGPVSVTNPATAAVQIAGSITNTVTVGTHPVTQSGTWTVLNGPGSSTIGNVGVTNTVNVVCLSGCSGGGGGSSPTTVTNPATAAVQVAGSITNTVSVATHGVTQSGAWNVGLNSGSNTIGNVGITNTVNTFVTGGTISVTANVSGVTVTNTATNAVQVAGSITNTVTVATHGVTQSGGWNVGLLGGSNTIGNVGITSTVNTVVTGGALSATISGAVSVTNPATAAVQVAGSITNTVNTNVTNASIPVTQSGGWNVGLLAGSNTIGAVGITHTVATQGSITNTVAVQGTITNTATNAVQIAGSITNTVATTVGNVVDVNVTGGTIVASAAVSVTNPATSAVQIAGSITNTVNVNAFQAGPWSITATVSVGAVTVTNTASNAVQVAGSITNTVNTAVTSALPAGTNYIGAVGISNTVATTATISGGVSVTNPATAAVQIAGSITNTVNTAVTSALPAGTNYIGAVGISNTVATTATISGGVSVTNPASAAVQVAGSITNTVTVATHAVTQSGTWNLGTAGNVSLNAGTASIGSVGLNAGTNYIGAVGISNTVATTATISGGVSVTNPATAAVQIAGSITNTVNTAVTSALPAGTNYIGAVGVSNTVNTTIGTALPAGTNYIGAVGISNTVATTATISGGVSVTNPATAAVQIAGSITNTVTVGTHAVTQSGTWNLGTAGNVSLNAGTASIGSVGLNAGTNYIGAVGVSGTVALPANQSVNVAQMNGVAVTMGNGTSGTGVQRVVIASDNTSNTNPFLVNQSQVNGVAVSTGNGVAGTGVQRMTIASDNTPFQVGISHTVAVSGSLTSAGNVSLNAGTAVVGAVGITNSAGAGPQIPIYPMGVTFAATVSGIQYASITFTAVGGSANGVTIVSAVSAKTIAVLGWSVSTDAAIRITLHHQGAAAVRSNTASNIIGGGLFGANGGEAKSTGPTWLTGLAQNQPVCADFSGAANVEVTIAYITY